MAVLRFTAKRLRSSGSTSEAPDFLGFKSASVLVKHAGMMSRLQTHVL